jgi:uncharacterized membrane protein
MRYSESELGIEVNAKSVMLWLLDIALWLVLLPARISVMVFRFVRRGCHGIDLGMFWKMPLIYLTVFPAIFLIITSGVKSRRAARFNPRPACET